MMRVFQTRMEIEEAETEDELQCTKNHFQEEKDAEIQKIGGLFEKISATEEDYLSQTEDVEDLRARVEKFKYYDTILKEITRKEMEMKGILF